MELLKKLKENQYIENMKNASKTQLSLLNTLNELQTEYEKMFTDKQKEVDELKKKITTLENEILKLKSNKWATGG